MCPVALQVSTEANHYAYYYYYNVPEGEAYADDVHADVDRARAGGGGGQGADLYHSSAHERDFTHSANIGTIITICNIVLNLLLVALILARRSTRLQFVYQQVGVWFVVSMFVRDIEGFFFFLHEKIVVYTVDVTKGSCVFSVRRDVMM